MAVFATMTSKGQITVPLSVRQQLGLKAGDRLAFESLANDEVRIKPVSRGLDGLIGRLAGYALAKPLQPDDIEQARAAEFSENGADR